MSMSAELVRTLLERAGLKPTPEQVETTADIYNALADRLAQFPNAELENIEPHSIQPTRKPKSTRRS
jgi:hypothetical protein